MDQMIVLATGHAIILQLSVFGMRYACQQKALSTSGEASNQIRYNSTLFIIFITLPMGIILALIMTFFITGFDNPLLFILYPLSFLLLIIMELESMLENSLFSVERTILLRLSYSILNSVLVPIFYLINQSIEGVILAWNVALLITILLDIAVLKRTFQQGKASIPVIKSLLSFSFPIYLGTLPNTVSNNINNIVTYEFLEPGAASIFYWPNRILTMAFELILILNTGSQELFTHLNAVDKTKLRDSLLGLFRIITIASSVLMLILFLNAEIIVLILLGEHYIDAIILFRLLCIAWIFTTVTTVLDNLIGAQGNQKVIVKANLLNFSNKIILLIILIQFGLIGVVFTEILSRMIKFFYLVKNIESFRSNDNFIRLFFYVAILLAVSAIESIIKIIDLISLITLNCLFIFIALVLFILLRPLTNIDIDYLNRLLPKEISRFLRYYKPSTSIYS